MPLNAKYDKIKDYKNLVYVPARDPNGEQARDAEGELLYYVNSATEALVWATIYIGVNEITEKNYKEFYARLRLYNDTFGALVCVPKKETVFVLHLAETGDVLSVARDPRMLYRFAIDYMTTVLRESNAESKTAVGSAVVLTDLTEKLEREPHGEFFFEVEGTEFQVVGVEVIDSFVEGPDVVTLDVVHQHVGLHTNATPMTRPQFIRNIIKRQDHELNEKHRNLQREATAVRHAFNATIKSKKDKLMEKWNR